MKRNAFPLHGRAEASQAPTVPVRLRLAAQVVGFTRHVQHRWYLYMPVALIWVLAGARVLVDPTPRLPLLFNWTESLPYRVAWLTKQSEPLQRGDFVVFRFSGDARTAYPGLDRQPFFKIVRGLPGDIVTVVDRTVFINGAEVGTAKTHTFDRRPLEPIAPTVIPPGHYYVQGTGPNSFDSRYRSSGLIRADQVIGTALPIF